MRCTICKKEAVYEARYSGAFLCQTHFSQSVERRVRREARSQIRLENRKGTIAVAISGGKDSSLTLKMIHELYSKWKGVSLFAFTIDEGISGYRENGLASARRLCESMGIPHFVLSYEEAFGTTMDREVSGHPGGIPCSKCGPMRRNLINRASLKVNADYVALGMNLDDYAQSVMMNVVRGDYDRLKRMAPHEAPVGGMVRRVTPLRLIPEKEVLLYCMLQGIEYDHSWCPYYGGAQRNYFRAMIDGLESEFPGSRFAILKFADRIRTGRLEKKAGGPGACIRCGSPTSAALCPVCRMTAQGHKIPGNNPLFDQLPMA